MGQSESSRPNAHDKRLECERMTHPRASHGRNVDIGEVKSKGSYTEGPRLIGGYWGNQGAGESTAILRTRASTDTQESRTAHRTQEERPHVTKSALPRFFVRPQIVD